MKVSLITACFNSAKTLLTTMDSVIEQRGVDVEYIVIDGGSTDGSVDIIKDFESKLANPQTLKLTDPQNLKLTNSQTLKSANSQTRKPTNFSFRWISERDKGMYDAMNKGIKMATGGIVGILNADDVLETPDTLAHIDEAFESEPRDARNSRKRNNDGKIEAVYADIRFVKDGDTLAGLRAAPTVRYCSAARWHPWMFRFGAMVPHPSFYVRRECFARLGGYSLDYRICSDFELELRYLGIAGIRAAYLPECVVTMRMGGASTAGWRSTIEINREDLRALRTNGVWSCLPIIYLKYLFKIWGFIFKGKV